MNNNPFPKRIETLKQTMLSEKRFVSIEQARIITETYRQHEGKPVILKRAYALKNALEQMEISVYNQELIVGNRTSGVRAGVVFPESGSSWVNKEFETIPTRPQDRFEVRSQDVAEFRDEIYPFWQGKCLEDVIRERYGKEIDEISKVVKINQKDHAQGHICPNCHQWLELGPAGISQQAQQKLTTAQGEAKEFYESIILVMEGASAFMRRYADLMAQQAAGEQDETLRHEMQQVSQICDALASRPAKTFHEAVQSLWFLFVILHMESNASSFSPGRMDQYLHPYYAADKAQGTLTDERALELIECLWLKFNQIVYLRNSHSAKYFAGFPIGFNVAIGGQNAEGEDAANELSFLFLEAQEHLGLPQPNLSTRLHEHTSQALLEKSVQVVAKGSGMPQFFNDAAVVPALMEQGITREHAMDYAIVGCVELTPQGNALGWSDAAMFNLNKALELTLNHGVCLLTGEHIGLDLGGLDTYATFEELEAAFAKQIEYFVGKMILACEVVEHAHMEVLPSPFLSGVIDDCLEKGCDVTRGGAHYNLSGIQMIQVANLADSLAALKKLLYDERRLDAHQLLKALQEDFSGEEALRLTLLNHAPKYGNDEPWVDALGQKWAELFNRQLREYRNVRGGPYHTGLYTVSAHVPMGENVGATPDGRKAGQPLADGGMSPVYGRDLKGPTAVLLSVSRIDSTLASNGGLLNMKFLPEFFNEQGVQKFCSFLRTFVQLKIPHIQFNVLRREDLLAAKQDPERYRGLTVRVAGYTAYFTELADELQNEIIARTSYGDI